MDCLIFPFFVPFASRPLIGAAGIAGKSGSPENSRNGNRGKGINRPSLERMGVNLERQYRSNQTRS